MLLIVLLTSILAILFSFLALYLNSFILFSIFYCKRAHVNRSMILIYFKFGLDAIIMFFMFFVEIYNLSTSYRVNLITKNIAFLLVWPSSSTASIRSTLALLISISRVIAACFPIFFRRYQEKIIKFEIILILIPDGLLDQLVMIGFCKNSINTPLECDRFFCAINSCYYFYWVLHEQTVGCLNVVFSLILCIRILSSHYSSKTQTNKKLSIATRIALLNAFIVFFFNIIPSYAFANFTSANIEVAGPMATVTKTLGFVIEGLITRRVLFRKPRVSPGVASPNVVVTC
ncbi:Serpentine Receptor, class BC (Class B-like) [Caenorhabditis elegans]|uniref:Serpentine Receptor, class BC (Class B-like) n=1 Tax=Caenorhabditis elegans TaxID=6239 RepID=G5EGF9_CAEEL|nr:Serpentine Receptor, class BC (Class B-like) [Caenorhabditis elegans]NP_503690.2 Serpentine Receptor, class BC (Class B-like) [Caenorhabditis elegans]CCD62303.1 Serpentine Receptor, class BC (Class B-like) [Caenorhabditis elegans]CCD64376.1 Serpentine Receptor, class BC (Class B-like) [Caenorhabditis elegans]|eukprot:NP_001041190.1 Uncharacterized protein CELE_Y19D10A.17 [Caenorhabditis elegans]